MKHVRALLFALLAARLLLGCAYSVLTPLGEAPDEADHYAYAAYIGNEGHLPAGPEMTQAKHPPLYHMLAAAAAIPIGHLDFTFLRSNPSVSVVPGTFGTAPNFFVHTRLEDWPWRGGPLAMHLGRLVSVLAGVLLVGVTFGLGRRVWPARPGLALAAAAFVAFLPEGLFVAGAMSNDTLAAALGTMALWLALNPLDDTCEERSKPGPGWQQAGMPEAILAGLCLGLAFVTKVSTLALWPVVALAMSLDGLQEPDDGRPRMESNPNGSLLAAFRTSRWQVVIQPLAALAVAFAIAIPWLWRNSRLYGDPMGTRLMLATVDRRQGALGLSDLWWLLRGWFFSFWGKFGGAGHLSLPWPFYVLWALLIVVAVAGWLRWRLQARACAGLLRETRPAAHVVLWASPVLVALSILSYTRLALGTDQGRLLFPAIAPLALLVVGGLAAWFPARRPGLLPGCVAAVMGTIAVLALVVGIVVPFEPPAVPGSESLAAAQPVGKAFGNDVELISLRWESGSPPPDGLPPRLTLYWRAGDYIKDDLRTVLRLRAPDGTQLWEGKRSPGAGRLSTDRWRPGQVVADEYQLPPELARQAVRAELGVQAFPNGPWWQPDGAGGGRSFLELPAPQP